MKENFPRKTKTMMDNKDKEASMENFKNLNSFIEQVNLNIQNLDTILNSNPLPKKARPSLLEQDCNDIQGLVKRSVEGLGDILKMNSSKGFGQQNSTRNINKKSFEIIEEEQAVLNPQARNIIANSKRMKLTDNKEANNIKLKKNNNLIVNTNIGTKSSQKALNSTRNKNEISTEVIITPPTNSNSSNAIALSKYKKEVVMKPNLDKKPQTANQPNRNKSVNKRYEVDERDSSVNRTRENRSPQPIKSYQLKPKRMLVNMNKLNSSANNSQININSKDSAKNVIDYTTSNDIKVKNIEIKNFFNEPKSSRNEPKDNPLINSFDKSFNKRCSNNNILNEEFIPCDNIQSFINLAFIYNESNKDKLKDFNDKLISEDLTKLLLSLRETDEQCETNQSTILGFEGSALSKIKHGLKNKRDEKRYNSKNLDISKITQIQRHWRKFTSQNILKTDEREKILGEMKKNTLNNISQNDSVKKLLSGMNNILGQFNHIVKNNKGNITNLS
jgi:hypothetical protein